MALPATALADSNPNHVQSHDCGNDRSISLTGSQTLWPPNHKFRPYTVTATGNALDSGATVESTVTHDEIGLTGDGGPRHADFASPNPAAAMDDSNTVSVVQTLRSQRSGRGDGRVYTFNVHATWDMGLQSCDATFTVSVPHDQRKS
jgi:hypothetical protein